MSMINKVNWFEAMNFPQHNNIYVAAIDTVATKDTIEAYIIMKLINKNKRPERHEILILVSNGHNSRIEVVDRYVKGRDFHGNLGDVSISLILNDTLLFCTATIDDTKNKAMFPASSWVVPSNQRKPLNYNA